MKVKPINVPDIPEFVTGKLRKDGKPDRRYTTGMYMLSEFMDEVSGISESVKQYTKRRKI